MKPEWILVANASHARLLEHERGSPMVVLKSFEHPQSRAKVGDLSPDRLGRENADRSYGGTTYPPRMDAKQKEHKRFALELAELLKQGVQQEQMASLRIFASSPFLGELTAALDAGAKRRLSKAHDLDLTSFGLSELEQRIKRESAL